MDEINVLAGTERLDELSKGNPADVIVGRQ